MSFVIVLTIEGAMMPLSDRSVNCSSGSSSAACSSGAAEAGAAGETLFNEAEACSDLLARRDV